MRYVVAVFLIGMVSGCEQNGIKSDDASTVDAGDLDIAPSDVGDVSDDGDVDAVVDADATDSSDGGDTADVPVDVFVPPDLDAIAADPPCPGNRTSCDWCFDEISVIYTRRNQHTDEIEATWLRCNVNEHCATDPDTERGSCRPLEDPETCLEEFYGEYMCVPIRNEDGLAIDADEYVCVEGVLVYVRNCDGDFGCRYGDAEDCPNGETFCRYSECII